MKVKDILTDDSKWAKGHQAYDAYLYPCNYDSPYATKWCLAGAVCKAYNQTQLINSVIDKLWRRLSGSPTCWNDAAERTFPEVIALVEELDI